MTRRRALRSTTVAAVVLLGGGCGAQGGAPSERPDGRLVLVSGRDDHGYLRLDRVEVYDSPDQERVVGSVADGSLARVQQIEGQMLEVATLEGDPVTGWVDDFYLRGTLHLVGPAPTCRARLRGTLQEPGMQVVVRGARNEELLVESVVDPDTHGWVSRGLVQELPPQGPDCGADPEEAEHTH